MSNECCPVFAGALFPEGQAFLSSLPAVFVIVHAAPGGPRRRHVREVIHLSSLFLPSLQLFPSKTIEVTVRIHTMAAAR